MMHRAMNLLIPIMPVMILLRADSPTPTPNSLPLPQLEETLSQALSEAETVLTERILSNAVIRIEHRGTRDIPLENISLEVDGIALVHLTHLLLRSSPVHIISVTPDLRLMNMHLHANISLLEVIGNYTVSVEIMNNTSRTLITSDKGILNLTFQNLGVSGLVGLNMDENNLQVHTVDLLYRPNMVVLRIHYKDAESNPQVTEERSSSAHGTVQEPIYSDLAKRLNILMREELNKILRNITIPHLMGNNSETETRFKASANTQIGNVNDFVDYILNITKENLTNEICIPDFEKSFGKRIGFIRISGSFKAEGGWLKNLNSLQRTADVTVNRVNNSIQVNAVMGLKSLKFGYTRYTAKLLYVGPRGRIAATVGSNSMTLRGTVRYTDNKCIVTLQELRVTDLRDIDLKLTGLYPFNWILSKMATPVTNRSKFNIATAIEETVGRKVREKLQGFDCRQYFPEPAVRNSEHITPGEN